MLNKLYIGNLPFSTNEDQVRDTFTRFGDVQEVILIKDRATGRLKGFGFVTMSTKDGADAALAMDGQDFFGRNIRVNIAKAKEEGSNDRGDRRRF